VNGIVVDASVTLSWCFSDEQTSMSIGVLDRLKVGERAIVPAFWTLEVLNALLVGERGGRITADQTSAFFDTLGALNPVLDYASLEEVAGPVQTICRDQGLTPYDAIYVHSRDVRDFRWLLWTSCKGRRREFSAFIVCNAGEFAGGSVSTRNRAFR
jgi:predicted nucleic acid-binding protein